MLVFQKSQSHSQHNESDLVNSLQRYCFLPTSASFSVKIYQNRHFFADNASVALFLLLAFYTLHFTPYTRKSPSKAIFLAYIKNKHYLCSINSFYYDRKRKNATADAV